MHDRWEYKILTSRLDGSWLRRSAFRDEQGTEYGGLTEDALNRLGQEGWEVCVYTFSGVSDPTLILKRKANPAR